MAMTTTVRHHSSVDLHHACNVEASLVSTGHATEVYLRLSPVASGTSRNACHIQAPVLYDALDEVLHGLGARADHVLVEKVFFRNLARDHDDFDATRRAFYRKRGLMNGHLPAVTYLGLPPCRPGVDVELQVYAIIPRSHETVSITTYPTSRAEMSIKLAQVGRARHLFLNGATGQALNGEPNGFREQSDRMFRIVRDALAEHGASFDNVLRTWLHVADIQTDYGELNASRNAFFEEEGVKRLPASTGVGAPLHVPSARCGLDVYALLDPQIAEIEVMKTPGLNESSEYGSAFSRGIKMTLSESAYLFLSATPGIDEEGRTVHEDNPRAQIDRMLSNLEGLLHGHGATWNDLAHAVTYLKSPEYLEVFETACAERGIDEVPHSIVQADICRPDLVSEMEALAVIPSR